MRRILRIWPLYYSLLIVTFFIIPALYSYYCKGMATGYYTNLIECFLIEPKLEKFFFFFMFLPNFALFMFTPLVGMSQSWSVGVEEQFYLFWPWIVMKFKNNLIIILTIIIILKFAVLHALPYLNVLISIPYYNVVRLVLVDFKIELMALGGIGAVIYHKYNNVLNFIIYKKYFTWLVSVLGIIIIATNTHCFLFGIVCLLIIFLAIDKRSNIFINKQLNSLGCISYGIYMYHPLVMFFSFSVVYKLNLLKTHLLLGNLLAYTLTFGGTILVSYFSYQYFEKIFFAFKEKYTS